MNGLKIREKINLNNQLIQNLITPNVFTLNNTIANLLAENRRLQEICNHEYEQGYCVYCDKQEEEKF